MDAKDEYNRIMDGLRDNLDLLLASGMTHIPVFPAASRAVKTEEPGPAKTRGLRERVLECGACGSAPIRKKVVSGAGSPEARLVFIGGAPSEADSIKGVPFSAETGELLTKMIEAMGFKRSEVYILNSVRCASSVEPSDEEVASCRGFMEEELENLSPRVVVTLGPAASLSLLGGRNVGELRGRFHEWRGIKVMATYGTAELLKDPALKKDAWEDLKMVMKEIRKR